MSLYEAGHQILQLSMKKVDDDQTIAATLLIQIAEEYQQGKIDRSSLSNRREELLLARANRSTTRKRPAAASLATAAKKRPASTKVLAMAKSDSEKEGESEEEQEEEDKQEEKGPDADAEGKATMEQTYHHECPEAASEDELSGPPESDSMHRDIDFQSFSPF